ncbi:hypothetical protein [Gracilimonas tropica]|uniref:hypothetical protein n=1 Tax=Gracilimonas tropica TaxID=454600 RepID=UPI0014613EDD
MVECTSYWYWVADWCDANKVPLTLANAKMLKAINHTKVKTESVDARTLAKLLRVGLIPEARQCHRDRRDLRELTRAQLRVGNSATVSGTKMATATCGSPSIRQLLSPTGITRW